jgi:N-acetylmuramoyl-L-alanine amidase
MIIEKYLTPNKYSRPQTKLKKVKAIAIHWTGNPTSTALANIKFFEQRKDGKLGFGSAHFFVDLNSDIYRCIPEDELAYHVGGEKYNKDTLKLLDTTYPNNCTLGIEMCVNKDNKFNKETYDKTVLLATYLLKKYDLFNTKYLLRHYDFTGKICPAPFVKDESVWIKFKQDVDKCLAQYSKIFSNDMLKML